jgi:penicillin-binding protein 2
MPERTAERPGSLVETHKGYDPRILLFYPLIALLLLVLAGGLAYQQLIRTDVYHQREKQQNQRRILMPGPRGNIFDREGRLLVGNRARFAVTLNLDELRSEFVREERIIRRNYNELGDEVIPSRRERDRIARYTVVQRYLDQVNKALGRIEKLDADDLNTHFNQQLLLPFTLLDDLKPEEYAKLVEQLPVRSPLQVYASSVRDYPYGSAAAHTLGYVSVDPDIAAPEDFPGAELKLTTFKMPGTVGKSGLEKQFDAHLQGTTGGTVYRVDPSGYRIDPALEKKLPKQGKNLITSLDIDLQIAAEQAMAGAELKGAAAVLDVATGEVLVLVSKPDYDLNQLSPRITTATFQQIEESGGWFNRALQGIYAPGSTFKILTTIAGMRAGAIQPDSEVDCQGVYMLGNKALPCHDRHAHGKIKLPEAIARSCNVFFYKHGLEASADVMATEARRFQLHQKTGIELPAEYGTMLVPDPAWKRSARDEGWVPGDTTNMAIGQGFMGFSPLQMACFTASVARRQSFTKPTLIHISNRPALRNKPGLDLSEAQYAALVRGMEECTQYGTAKMFSKGGMVIPGLRIAGKTGTAQKRTEKGTLNFAWFICFAPVDKPEIAMAIMMEGDTPDEETGGGAYSAPIAHAILKKWWEKKNAAKSSPPPAIAAR